MATRYSTIAINISIFVPAMVPNSPREWEYYTTNGIRLKYRMKYRIHSILHSAICSVILIYQIFYTVLILNLNPYKFYELLLFFC